MKRNLIFLFLLVCAWAEARTLEVGPEQLFTSLRKAVDMAQPGDTILLHKGRYREGNIIINKSIRLIGLNSPVLEGENKYEILTVSGRGVIIKGIHFRQSGYSSMHDFASINLVDAQFCILENNII